MQAPALELSKALSALIASWPPEAAELAALAAEAEELAAGLEGGQGELARALAEALRHLEAGRIEAPEVAFSLASTSDTLARSLAPGSTLGAVPVAAARHELETFFPSRGPRPPEEPDVPASSLRRDRR